MISTELLHFLILTCVLSVNCDNKKIIFRAAECQLKGNRLQKVECFLEASNAFTIQIWTNNIKVHQLLGISDVIFNTNGIDGIRFKGIRLDLCKMGTNNQPSILSIIQFGLASSENNLPKKCNFEQNNTYYVRHAKFDSNYLPLFMPEYNFTYIGKFLVNYVKTFEVSVVGSLVYENVNYTKI